MNSSVGYFTEIYNDVIIYLYQYIGIPLYILGSLGNFLSIWILLKKTWRKNVCVFYFLNCLVVDSIYINSTLLSAIVINGFNINLQNSSVILCKLSNYVTFFSTTLSPTILVLASVDRLLISSQNVETRLYSSRRLAYFSISISTIFWFIFYFHVLIKFDLRLVAPFIYVCLFDPIGFYYQFFTYSLLIINVLFFLIMIILSVLSFKNVRRIRSIPRQQRSNIRSMRKKDFQLLRCLFARDIVHIVCNTLITIYAIYKDAIQSQIQTTSEETLDNFLFDFSSFILNLSPCFNFFIYIIILKAFRQEVKRLIWKIFGKDLTAARTEEQEAIQENIELKAVSTIVLTA